jgi:FMN phosphatase YigB (HAD superfamily)
MIRAIFYDLGDIFFEAHYWRKWMWETLSNMNYFKGSFKQFYDAYESFLLPVYENQLSYDTAFNNFLRAYNVPDQSHFKQTAYERKRHFEMNRKLFSGVFETLEFIKQKNIWNIIVSDNEATADDVRAGILDRFGINNLIHEVLTSYDLQITKSRSSFFNVALDKLKLMKDDILFVAHDQDEIKTAKSVGITVIEFNNYLNVATQADYRIAKFTDLLNFINNKINRS